MHEIQRYSRKVVDTIRGFTHPILLRRTIRNATITSTLIGGGIEIITRISDVQHPLGELVAIGAGIFLGSLVTLKESLPNDIPEAYRIGRRDRLLKEEFADKA